MFTFAYAESLEFLDSVCQTPDNHQEKNVNKNMYITSRVCFYHYISRQI